MNRQNKNQEQNRTENQTRNSENEKKCCEKQTDNQR